MATLLLRCAGLGRRAAGFDGSGATLGGCQAVRGGLTATTADLLQVPSNVVRHCWLLLCLVLTFIYIDGQQYTSRLSGLGQSLYSLCLEQPDDGGARASRPFASCPIMANRSHSPPIAAQQPRANRP